MGNNKTRLMLTTAILLVVFMVVSFAVPFAKTATFWTSLIFGIIAIAVQFAVVCIAFSGADSPKSKFYGFPIARIGIVYGAVQVVLSMVFMGLAAITPAWIAVVAFVIILGVASIGLIGADAMKEEIIRQENTIKADTSFIKSMTAIMNSLISQCDNPNAKALIAKLSEDFRYSDPVSADAVKPTEKRIEEQVNVLKDLVATENYDEIANAVKQIKNSLAERNQLCRVNK